MLTLIVCGLVCGANDVKAIWHKCGPLDENQRRAIGLTRRNKKTGQLEGALVTGDALNCKKKRRS